MTDVAMPSSVRLGWEVDCPYRGLMPYTENDSHYFFGRDQDSRLIVDNLRAYPLSVLFGPSGVGKSSVLRAGVTRVVREHTARKHERFGFIEAAAAYFSDWRDDPRASLPRVLAAEIQRATEQDPGFRRDLLDPPAVIESCSQLGLDLLIVLDQFEEFFLYHEADADAFGRVLQQLLAPGSRVSILLSIREDSLARLDELEGALPGVFDHTLRLEHLDRESASEAVLLPVERYNADRPESLPWSVEPALVESLLDQVAAGQVRVTRHGDDDGERMVEHGLIEAPYLQLAPLLRLWFEETAAGSHVLRRQTLDRLGGAEAIVREHLDRVVAAFPLEEHPVLAAVFGHLVTPGGTKIAHRASDLALMTHIEEARVRHVLNRLTQGDQRILREVDPPGDDLGSESRFEVFHDVLALAILDGELAGPPRATSGRRIRPSSTRRRQRRPRPVRHTGDSGVHAPCEERSRSCSSRASFSASSSTSRPGRRSSPCWWVERAASSRPTREGHWAQRWRRGERRRTEARSPMPRQCCAGVSAPPMRSSCSSRGTNRSSRRTGP